jgi:hypothetical protein
MPENPLPGNVQLIAAKRSTLETGSGPEPVCEFMPNIWHQPPNAI